MISHEGPRKRPKRKTAADGSEPFQSQAAGSCSFGSFPQVSGKGAVDWRSWSMMAKTTFRKQKEKETRRASSNSKKSEKYIVC